MFILKFIKQTVFAILTIVIAIVVIDLGLNVAANLRPRIAEVTSIVEAKIPDDRLGRRPNPAYPGHDANGFRNQEVPNKAGILALGDSHTYGSGVQMNEAWPQVLGQLAGQTTYNMGLGGYGPLESRLLWDEAMVMSPDIVIFGFYAGNDLYDAYSLVYHQDKAGEFKSNDAEILDTIGRDEQAAPIGPYVSRMYRRGRVRSDEYRALKTWLETHSMVYRVLARFQFELKQIRKRAEAEEKQPDPERDWAKAQAFAEKFSAYAQEFSDGPLRTIFTSEYRLAALNQEDSRILEGRRMSFEAIRQMAEIARSDGIRFIVLFVPTKEMVFAEKARNLRSDSYQTLVQNESVFWQATRQFLADQKIEYIDGLQPLREPMDSGIQTYKLSHDGHPNPAGQRALAQAIFSYLERNP